MNRADGMGRMSVLMNRVSGARSRAFLRSAAVVALGLTAAACVMSPEPKKAAVQQPAAASEAQAYRVASAPAVISSDAANGIPLPRMKPELVGQTASLPAAAKADAVPGANLAGPDALAQAAANYRAFTAAVDDLATRRYKSPNDVRGALEALRPYEPKLLAEGWIAHSAYLAASQPSFKAALRSAVNSEGRSNVLAQLRSGTGVWRMDGAQDARLAVVADAAADYDKLTGLGERFLATAHEFQRTRWGSYQAPAPFSVPRDFAAAEVTGEGFGSGFAAVIGEVAGIKEAQAATPVMQRILSLAGRIAIESTDDKEATQLLSNRDLNRCTRFARLNLNQCLAAAHFPSEEAYCTGKHGMNEIASCWAQYIPAAAAE